MLSKDFAFNYNQPVLEFDQPVTIKAVQYRAAFYIDFYAAAYIILNHDQQRNRVPSEIQKILNAGQFDMFAKMGELPEDYHDVQTAFIVLNLMHVPAVRVTNSYFHVYTEFPSMCRDQQITDIMTKNEPAVCIPAQKAPQLFKVSYENPNDLIQEYKNYLGNILPENFDYWKNICCIAGNHIVYD